MDEDFNKIFDSYEEIKCKIIKYLNLYLNNEKNIKINYEEVVEIKFVKLKYYESEPEKYYNDQFGTNFNLNIVSPGRSFHGNYYLADFFIKPSNINSKIRLQDLIVKENPLRIDSFDDIEPLNSNNW